MIFERHKSVFPTFPYWDSLALHFPTLDYRMMVVSEAEMHGMRWPKQDRAEICGMPIYISENKDGTEVTIWPTPDRDYEVVRVE